MSIDWSITITVISVAFGVGATFWAARKNNRDPKPVYQSRSRRLFGDVQSLPNHVEVRFKDKPVTHLSETLIFFWNAGRGTLRGSDINSNDQLRLELASEFEILSVSLLKQSNSINKIACNIDNENTNTAQVDYDFIERNDGVTIRVYHTSPESAPQVRGTIIGVPEGISNLGRVKILRSIPISFRILKTRLHIRLPKRSAPFVIVAGGILLVLLAFMALPELKTPITSSSFFDAGDPWAASGAFSFIGIVYIGLGAMMWWQTRRKIPNSLLAEWDYEEVDAEASDE